jgi:hypothetical protein
MICLSALLVACAEPTPDPTPTDGAAGVAVFHIDNDLDVDLEVTFTAGPIAAPEVLATLVAAGESVAVFTSSGCLGCYDHPSDVLGSLTLADADTGEVIAEYDPVEDLAWTVEASGEFNADWTLSLVPDAE